MLEFLKEFYVITVAKACLSLFRLEMVMARDFCCCLTSQELLNSAKLDYPEDFSNASKKVTAPT